MPPNPIAEKYGSFFHLAREHQVIFYYMGYFSQHIVAAMADAVKLQLEMSGVAGPTRRKLFSCFIEMAQNIVHYSADALTSPTQRDNEVRHGAVCIRREPDGGFLLLCANPVEARIADRDRIVEVVRVIESRVGAPVAETCYVDHSPAPVAEPLPPGTEWARGAGRPSKRLRRELDRMRRGDPS